MIEVRSATQEDAASLAPNLRQADVQEITAASGLSPGAALRLSVAHSINPQVAVIGQPLFIFGVVPDPTIVDLGWPWMLGTDAIVQHRFEIIRRCRPYVEALSLIRPRLCNWVDYRNTAHLRFIRWAGFRFTGNSKTFRDPTVPFLEFTR